MKSHQFFQFLFRFAAAYNIIVGTIVVLFPQLFFRMFDLPEINHSYVMSGLGMFVAIYGFGFYLVSVDLIKNYHFAILGFVGKTFGVIGWLWYTYLGVIPLNAVWANILNDMIWLPLFIVYFLWRKKNSS